MKRGIVAVLAALLIATDLIASAPPARAGCLYGGPVISKCDASVQPTLSNRLGGAEDAQGVIEKGCSSLSGNTNHLTYTSTELLHHFFMSRATGEVAPG